MGEQPIYEKLVEHAKTGGYPWHMPGHKRKWDCPIENPFMYDITEIEGMDEFHAPNGMIREAYTRAAKIYGSDESFYLVNGGTSGILSAISAVCREGDKIILARNCHRSVYHAVRLLRLQPIYIYPEYIKEFNICGGIRPMDIKELIKEYPEVKAVVLVSPTYEGVVSDIEKIAKILHKDNIPLIVDQAHGAHFEFMWNIDETLSDTGDMEFPVPALRLGADIVIESLHKTLPALTQTAILHIKSTLVDKERLKEFLSIYQTTSPSYVLMASIDYCIDKMHHEADDAFIRYKELLNRYRKYFKELKHIRMVFKSDVKHYGGVSYDVGKFVFSVKGLNITGNELAEELSHNYGQVVELVGINYVVVMTSVADDEAAFEMLRQAIFSIDEQVEETDVEDDIDIYSFRMDMETIPAVAMDSPKEMIFLSESKGRISGTYVCVYPPCIPILVPGEVVSAEAIYVIRKCISKKLNVKGIDMKNDGIIQVV